MGNISLNEALGRRDTILLSDAVGSQIEISSVTVDTEKDKDEKEFLRAYIVTTEGKTYRSSNKAILTKAKAMVNNLPKGSTLKVNVVKKKSTQKGAKDYIDFEAVE